MTIEHLDVLVVDPVDAPTEGCTTVVVVDGVEAAVALLAARRFDLVLVEDAFRLRAALEAAGLGGADVGELVSDAGGARWETARQVVRSGRHAAVDPDLEDAAPGFRERLVGRMDALEAAIAAEDYAEIRRVAHQIGGTAGYFGLPAVGVDAEVLCRSARAGNAAACRWQLRRMRALSPSAG